MKSRILIAMIFVAIFICTSCWGPKKSPEDENILNALSNIQRSLETETSYEQFIQMLAQVKMQINVLKSRKKNNPCFMSSLDKCIESYTTCAKAWEQKIQATNERRRQDMDLTLAVMQSFAALSLQRANNCFKK
ncbi:MAG: hypothetical protein P8X68_17825 [Desulfobacterales bacterium]|jgi:hypothetical protein